MKKITISRALVYLILFGLSQLFAASPLEFSETTHDFGTIKEADGPVNFKFTFVNNSKDEVEIYSVKAT